MSLKAWSAPSSLQSCCSYGLPQRLDESWGLGGRFDGWIWFNNPGLIYLMNRFSWIELNSSVLWLMWFVSPRFNEYSNIFLAVVSWTFLASTLFGILAALEECIHGYGSKWVLRNSKWDGWQQKIISPSVAGWLLKFRPKERYKLPKVWDISMQTDLWKYKLLCIYLDWKSSSISSFLAHWFNVLGLHILKVWVKFEVLGSWTISFGGTNVYPSLHLMLVTWFRFSLYSPPCIF